MKNRFITGEWPAKISGPAQSAQPVPAASSGSALVITLGILTLLSVLAVAFLSTSRILRRAAQSRQYGQLASDQMDTALYFAMNRIEESFSAANAAGGRRVAPAGRWFSTNTYSTTKYIFESGGVMTSPTTNKEEQAYVNLLTPQVLALVPSALTNGLPLVRRWGKLLRSGWSWLDDPVPGETPHPSRVAFAVMDLSGFIDANYFVAGPSTVHQARVCFNQSDITNWVSFTKVKNRLKELNEEEETLNTESPFSSLSYDSNPNIVPLAFPSNGVNPRLGTSSFGSWALQKFNLNSITNIPSWKEGITDYNKKRDLSPWYNDAEFKTRWLDPVTSLISSIAKSDTAVDGRRMPEGAAIAYSIANAMDEDHVPQISTFTTEGSSASSSQALATRVDYAVEDVPLINKITVFNIFKEGGGERDDLPDQENGIKFSEYGVTSSLSNHYAVAVEYWYPFAPNPLRGENDEVQPTFAAYIGIYTNDADISTTTNRAWSASLLRDWFRWNYTTASNTILQTLFTSWGNMYVSTVGPSLWTHPLWQNVTYDSSLWFTTSMTNHPYWPAADTNGNYDITQTPIWQSFYPATTNIVETNIETRVSDTDPPLTNDVISVTTNVYTLLTATNTAVQWTQNESSTNQFIGLFTADTAHKYPWTIWMLDDGTFTTNEITGLVTGGTTITFDATNALDEISFDGTNIWATVVLTDTNGMETVTTNLAENFTLQDETGSNIWTIASTNLSLTTNIARVPPLPMPAELGLILDGLMYSLPTNSVSSLYNYLMLTPNDDFNWDDLFRTLSSIPNLLNKLFPSIKEPSLGGLNSDERYKLFAFSSREKRSYPNKYVTSDKQIGRTVYDGSHYVPGKDFQGYFWTVYPKQTVNFMEVESVDVPSGTEGGTVSKREVTNYYALGALRPGQKIRNTIWIRPVTIINQDNNPNTIDYSSNQILDEALLEGEKVVGFTAVTNLYVPDPRRNAYATNWRGFPADTRWEEPYIRSTNISSVAELPFILPDRPFESIGELGNVYASYINAEKHTEQDNARRYESIDFAKRSCAALLDLFTLSDFSGAKRGLVQANTPYASVLQTLMGDFHAGWTNINIDNNTIGYISFNEKDRQTLREDWSNVYRDALTNNYTSWRCYADMMPDIITNRYANAAIARNLREDQAHPLHDYNEDIAAGFIDKVSFRQNVFMIVIAAQTLAPGSTEAHPVVLADRRAAVTVIRDAFTGRWAIASWRWLPY